MSAQMCETQFTPPHGPLLLTPASGAQGNQSLSRELRASALCPGLEAIKKASKFQKSIYFCFIEYAKALTVCQMAL